MSDYLIWIGEKMEKEGICDFELGMKIAMDCGEKILPKRYDIDHYLAECGKEG